MHKLINFKVLNDAVFLDFNEEKLKISLNTFDELGLKIGSEYKISEIKLTQKRNKIYEDTAKKMSIKLLSVYDCRKELLKKNVLDFQNIELIIQKLIKNHILDDEIYAERCLQSSSKELYGKYHIIKELKNHGISKSIVENLEFDNEDELSKARTYLKLNSYKYVSNNYNKQKRKIYNVLLKHGFDTDIIKKILVENPISNANEIDKLRRDLARIKSKLGIYKDLDELNESKIVGDLMKMGYSYRDIVDNLKEDARND